MNHHNGEFVVSHCKSLVRIAVMALDYIVSSIKKAFAQSFLCSRHIRFLEQFLSKLYRFKCKDKGID